MSVAWQKSSNLIGTAFMARSLRVFITLSAWGVHLNSCGPIFLVSTVKGFAILAKSLIHLQTMPTVPRNPQTSVGFCHKGHFLSLAVFSCNTCVLSMETIAPTWV